jgi:hypothetical protein
LRVVSVRRQVLGLLATFRLETTFGLRLVAVRLGERLFNPLGRARVPSILTASFLHASQRVAHDPRVAEARYRPRPRRTCPPDESLVLQAS